MTSKKTAAVQAKGENINVRVTPEIRFGIELLARKQRRNLSSVVEWALQKAIHDPNEGLFELDTDGNPLNLLDLLWDVDEFDRIYHMAVYKQDLLTYEEEKLIKLVRENELAEYFHETISKQTAEASMQTRLFCAKMREHYPILFLKKLIQENFLKNIFLNHLLAGDQSIISKRINHPKF